MKASGYSPRTARTSRGRWPAPVANEPLRAVVTVPGSKSLTNRELILASLAEVDLRTSPVGPRGVDHDYFTVGFQLLGLVLEIADGTPFPELLRHRLFDPLGMRHSGVRGDDESATLAGHVRGVPTAPPASAGPKDPRATSVTTAAPAAVGRTGVDGAPRRFVLSPYGCAWTAAMRNIPPIVSW